MWRREPVRVDDIETTGDRAVYKHSRKYKDKQMNSTEQDHSSCENGEQVVVRDQPRRRVVRVSALMRVGVDVHDQLTVLGSALAESTTSKSILDC